MGFDKYKERGGGAYHWIEYEQKTVYGMHARKVKKWVNNGKTLDVGAGDGLITSLLNCEGIDNNKIAVKLAKNKGVWDTFFISPEFNFIRKRSNGESLEKLIYLLKKHFSFVDVSEEKPKTSHHKNHIIICKK